MDGRTGGKYHEQIQKAEEGTGAMIETSAIRPKALGSVVGRDQLDDEPLLLLAANGDDRMDDCCAAGDGDAISDLDCVIVGLVTGRDNLIATSELIEIGDWRHPGRKPRDSGGGRAPDKPAQRNARSHSRLRKTRLPERCEKRFR